MSKAFDTINIHTLIRCCYRPRYQAQSLSSSKITSRDAKPTQHILTTSILNWRSTRRNPLTNTIKHFHCKHTTTQSTGSGHGLCRWHHHHIYTHKHEYIHPYPHKVFAWTKQNNLTLNPDKPQDTNIQHLHDETLILPIHEHLQLYASQYKQKRQDPSHPLHKHTTYFNTTKLKNTIFNNGHYTTNIPTDNTQSLQQT